MDLISNLHVKMTKKYAIKMERIPMTNPNFAKTKGSDRMPHPIVVFIILKIAGTVPHFFSVTTKLPTKDLVIRDARVHAWRAFF